LVGCSLERLDLGESQSVLHEGSCGFSDHVLVGHDGGLDDLDGLMRSSVLSLHVLVYNQTVSKGRWVFLHICEIAPLRVVSLNSLYMLIVSVLERYLNTMP
jgi:hypothetical protein